jgi:hypothetical protein
MLIGSAYIGSWPDAPLYRLVFADGAARTTGRLQTAERTIAGKETHCEPKIS